MAVRVDGRDGAKEDCWKGKENLLLEARIVDGLSVYVVKPSNIVIGIILGENLPNEARAKVSCEG